MRNEKSLDTKVFVLSMYQWELYDPAEHIIGFYSSRKNAEKQRIPMRNAGLYLYDGPDDDLHITPRTVMQIVEGAKKANSEVWEDSCDLGYGEICFEGHKYEYPWAHCYMDPKEIFERLDRPADIRRFLPKQDRDEDRNSDGIDTSGFDGWLNFDEGLWFRSSSLANCV